MESCAANSSARTQHCARGAEDDLRTLTRNSRLGTREGTGGLRDSGANPGVEVGPKVEVHRRRLDGGLTFRGAYLLSFRQFGSLEKVAPRFVAPVVTGSIPVGRPTNPASCPSPAIRSRSRSRLSRNRFILVPRLEGAGCPLLLGQRWTAHPVPLLLAPVRPLSAGMGGRAHLRHPASPGPQAVPGWPSDADARSAAAHLSRAWEGWARRASAKDLRRRQHQAQLWLHQLFAI